MFHRWDSRMGALTQGRQRNSAGITKTPPQSPADSLGWNAILLRPFSQDAGFTVYGHIVVLSSIARLFLWCCPSHVAHFIMSVDVYSIQRMLRSGLLANVTNKLKERGKPKLNSTSPIVSKPSGVLICTSFFCVTIGIKLRGCAHSVHRSTARLVSIASTGFSCALSQVTSSGFYSCTANATTPPKRPLVSQRFASETKNSQAVIGITSFVDKLWVIRRLRKN